MVLGINNNLYGAQPQVAQPSSISNQGSWGARTIVPLALTAVAIVALASLPSVAAQYQWWDRECNYFQCWDKLCHYENDCHLEEVCRHFFGWASCYLEQVCQKVEVCTHFA